MLSSLLGLLQKPKEIAKKMLSFKNGVHALDIYSGVIVSYYSLINPLNSLGLIFIAKASHDHLYSTIQFANPTQTIKKDLNYKLSSSVSVLHFYSGLFLLGLGSYFQSKLDFSQTLSNAFGMTSSAPLVTAITLTGALTGFLLLPQFRKRFYPVLHKAVTNNDFTVFKIKNGNTPLLDQLEKDQEVVIENINELDGNEFSLLAKAIHQGSFNAAIQLIENGANIHQGSLLPDGSNGTLFDLAVFQSMETEKDVNLAHLFAPCTKVIVLLSDKGAIDIKALNQNLAKAMHADAILTAEILLKLGADAKSTELLSEKLNNPEWLQMYEDHYKEIEQQRKIPPTLFGLVSSLMVEQPQEDGSSLDTVLGAHIYSKYQQAKQKEQQRKRMRELNERNFQTYENELAINAQPIEEEAQQNSKKIKLSGG